MSRAHCITHLNMLIQTVFRLKCGLLPVVWINAHFPVGRITDPNIVCVQPIIDQWIWKYIFYRDFVLFIYLPNTNIVLNCFVLGTACMRIIHRMSAHRITPYCPHALIFRREWHTAECSVVSGA